VRSLFVLAFFASQMSLAVDLDAIPVRVLLADGVPSVRIEASSGIRFGSPLDAIAAPPGRYVLTLVSPVAPVQRVHLFSKSFAPDANAALDAYLAELAAEGHAPELAHLGMRFQSATGAAWDTRETWVSIRRANSRDEAERDKRDLEQQGVFAWIQPEIVAPGRGYVVVETMDGAPIASFDAPLTIESNSPVTVADVNARYDSTEQSTLAYSGRLTLDVGHHERIRLTETLPLHDYLRGVLPAELHPSWHPEALRAQAVAIRSNAIAAVSGRYALEGFDFFGHERSHAYKGATGWTPETDAAIDATRGEILVRDGRIPQTVFHARTTIRSGLVRHAPHPAPAPTCPPNAPPARRPPAKNSWNGGRIRTEHTAHSMKRIFDGSAVTPNRKCVL